MSLATSLAGHAQPPLLGPGDLAYLEELAHAVVDASRVAPGAKVGEIGPNTSGGTLIRPGGRGAYPAFWIRDYAMSLESGLITPEEQRHALLLTARHQPDERIVFPSGSTAPPGSIPDHISFDGKPIFYPGVLEDYEAQGGPLWGKLPCLDDPFFFIHMAWFYCKGHDADQVLREDIQGKPLIQRLEEAFHMPPSDPDTHLVSVADEGSRGVNFGFFDTVVHTGELFFCSLLKWRAAGELEELFTRLSDPDKATRYRAIRSRIGEALAPTFALDSGLFRAATGTSAQPDVWGTAFAVYLGVLPGDAERKACQALLDAYRAGTMTWRGQIRHVLTTDDASESSAWEKTTGVARNRYQNGAYWATPAGWVCSALAQGDHAAAAQLASEYIAELRQDDFRKGPEHGAPWECMHEQGNHRQNPVYMTSVTCPLAAFRRAGAK